MADDIQRRPYGPFHIPLRLRRWNDPTGGENWLKWLRNSQPRPTFRCGKSWLWEPREQFIAPPKYDWVVESFDWTPGPDPDGLPPRWTFFRKFKTREEAMQFCKAWRDKEAADEARYAAEINEARRYLHGFKNTGNAPGARTR